MTPHDENSKKAGIMKRNRHVCGRCGAIGTMRDPVADSYSNRDTYTHTNPNPNSNGYSYTNGYVYSDAETYAESAASPHAGASPVNRSANWNLC